MDRYAPIFAAIVNSSLWEEPPAVGKLFVTMLALKDHDHFVRMDDYHLYRASHLTREEFRGALETLLNPDVRRAELGYVQEYDGRRIERVGDGFLVLNGAKYQERMSVVNQRARWAVGQQRRREREKRRGKGPRLPGESAAELLSRAGGTQDELDRLAAAALPDSLPQVAIDPEPGS